MAGAGSLPVLRAQFMRRIDEEGFRPCTPPQIRTGGTSEPARYDAAADAIEVAPRARSAADGSAGTDSTPAADDAGLRWAFVHELGHWWQACRHLTRPESYAAENGANRIALAFWREREPRFAAGIVHGFAALLGSTPSPVPAAQSAQAYFDANFSTIVQADAYTLFQGKMIVELAAETPAPSLHRALSQPLYPW